MTQPQPAPEPAQTEPAQASASSPAAGPAAAPTVTAPPPAQSDDTAAPSEPAAPAAGIVDDRPDVDERDGGPHREAARYRTRLREVEAERDRLTAALEGQQRREVERLAGGHLAQGADLWLAGTQLPELLDDAGAVDPDRVRAAAEAATAERPHWRVQRFKGTADGGQGRSYTPAPDLADLFGRK